MCVSQRMICGSPGFSFPGCPRDQAQGIRLSRSAFAFWAIFLALCLHCFLPSHLLVTLPYSGLESGVKALTELSLHLLVTQFLAGLVFLWLPSFSWATFILQPLVFLSVLFLQSNGSMLQDPCNKMLNLGCVSPGLSFSLFKGFWWHLVGIISFRGIKELLDSAGSFKPQR